MKTLIVAVVIAAAGLADANAQGRQGAPPQPPPPPPAPAARGEQSAPTPPPAAVNVRIDVTVIDEGGPQTVRENVTLTTTDRQETSFRSEADVVIVRGSPFPDAPSTTFLNVDATPQVSGLPAGKIRLRVGLDYLPKPIPDQPRGGRTRLQFAVILDDGKTVVASDTSDPATDRRVRIEVTATILK